MVNLSRASGAAGPRADSGDPPKLQKSHDAQVVSKPGWKFLDLYYPGDYEHLNEGRPAIRASRAMSDSAIEVNLRQSLTRTSRLESEVSNMKNQLEGMNRAVSDLARTVKRIVDLNTPENDESSAKTAAAEPGPKRRRAATTDSGELMAEDQAGEVGVEGLDMEEPDIEEEDLVDPARGSAESRPSLDPTRSSIESHSSHSDIASSPRMTIDDPDWQLRLSSDFSKHAEHRYSI